MERTIHITGKGYLKETPDQIRFSFDVNDHQWEYGDAIDRVNTKVEVLKELVNTAGIERSAVKSTAFSIDKSTTYDEKKKQYNFNGYIATHKMILRIPLDNNLINRVIKLITEHFSDLDFRIKFEIADPRNKEAELIENAVQNARENAEILAKASGVKLKEIQRIDYSFSEISYISRSEFEVETSYLMDASPMTEFTPDDIELNKNVSITWMIE